MLTKAEKSWKTYCWVDLSVNSSFSEEKAMNTFFALKLLLLPSKTNLRNTNVLGFFVMWRYSFMSLNVPSSHLTCLSIYHVNDNFCILEKNDKWVDLIGFWHCSQILCRVKVLKFKFLNLIVLPCLSIVIRDIWHVKNGQNILALTLIHTMY